LLLSAAGCGGGQVIEVSGQKMTIRDGSYITRPDPGLRFCSAQAPGQIKMTLVDFKPACKLDLPMGDPNPRKAEEEHGELEFILAVGSHPNLMIPFEVGEANCSVGPASEAIVYFKYYPPGANPEQPQSMATATGGTVKVDAYDKTNQAPTRGRFDVVFGGQTVSGTFENVVSCDP
jgi:hypothetical protein